MGVAFVKFHYEAIFTMTASVFWRQMWQPSAWSETAYLLANDFGLTSY